MKKLLLSFTLCVFAVAMYAQNYSVLPVAGKVLEYKAVAKTPMGDQNYVQKIFLKSNDGKTAVVTTSLMGQEADVKYVLENDKVSISLKEAMNSMLSQMGSFEVVEINGDMNYPAILTPNTELPSASMKVKVSVMGKELELDITVPSRKIEGEEVITVPAGEFKCIKVVEQSEVTTMGRTQKSVATVWYAPNVGAVKQVNDMGAMSSTAELIRISDK